MGRDRRRLLFAVDGSDQTHDAVRYVSGVIPPLDTDVVLFHVMNKVPDSFWDWEKDPLVPKHLEYLKNWEARREEQMRRFMRQARQILVDVGVPDYSVMISIQKIKEGVARDVLNESRRGYDALVMGRRGLGSLDEQLLGNVAAKTAAKLRETSLWLVGGRPKNGKILIGLDNSDGAMRAVEHVGKMVNVSNHAIGLIHVVRGISVSSEGHEQIFPEGYRRRLLEEAENEIRPAFDKAIRKLKGAGVRPDKIFTKIVAGVASRAGAILEEAETAGYGTIVVGRKGISAVEDFDMGRVSNKLTQLAMHTAVWVVS